jgi:hypothetical protein
MPLYFFRIRNGGFSGASGHGIELADHAAAWAEMTKVCGGLIGSIVRHLREDAKWQMELLDESKRPMFCIRLIAESFDASDAGVLPPLDSSRGG